MHCQRPDNGATTLPASPDLPSWDLHPRRTFAGTGKHPALLYIQNQVVNLDRIAEVSLKRERVTLCFTFARINDPGARLFLSPEGHEQPAPEGLARL